jgi:phosphatidylserine/phosphatidylglycerophosphate/cardiolipin synthase-like enzyme
MHHKFVVLDFDTARVYLGSYNFSEPGDFDNGENLVLIKDRYDHYRFRSAREKTTANKVIELRLPPKKASAEPWWQPDWEDPVRKRDRELFA